MLKPVQSNQRRHERDPARYCPLSVRASFSAKPRPIVSLVGCHRDSLGFGPSGGVDKEVVPVDNVLDHTYAEHLSRGGAMVGGLPTAKRARQRARPDCLV